MIASILPEPSLNFNEYELIASICRDDFYEFVKEFWSTVIAEEPVWNWHIQFVCRKLQIVAERVFKGLEKLHDLIINIPPGTTKSTIISVMFHAWCLTRMPSARTIVSTHTEQLGYDLSRKSRDVVKSEKYQKCFPYVQLRDDQDTKSLWMTTAGGLRMACTVGGKNPMGFHGHFLIVDDPVDPQKSLYDLNLETANKYMTETLSKRKVNKAVSVTILVMQRIHFDDPTGNWLRRNPRMKKLKHFCLPADLRFPVKPEILSRFYVNGLLDPVRIPASVLEEEEENSLYAFAGQYGQQPQPLGGGQFHANKIQLMRAPGRERFVDLVRYWDKAATPGAGKFTVGALLGLTYVGSQKQKQYWILDIKRGQWDSHTRETIMRQTAELDGVGVRIGIEREPASSGKESLQWSIGNLAGFRVQEERPAGPDKSKAARADPFSSQVNAGNVFMHIADWNKRLLEELAHFGPTAKFKDQVDACAGAFNMLSKPVYRAGALQ